MSDSGALVYVVDDDASAREGVAALIRSAGLTPKTFASAEEFLAAPRPETPSCLVLDVSLPGVSGLDLQQELAKSNLQIPIVFLTGHGDIPMTVRALKAGAANFLTKPFDDDDLLNSIHQCMKVAALEHRTRTLEQSLEERPKRAARALWVRADHRPLAGSSRDAHSCGPGGPHGDDRPDHRGKRDREGARGARDPSREPSGRRPLCRGQLRGAARHAPGVRAVRSRARRVHRSGPAEAGALRAGGARHALPRRDRRAVPRRAGEAPPCAAGARVPARRRDRDAQGRCPLDRRHQPRSGGRDGGGALPQRPLLPAERLQRAPARAAGARRRCAPPRRRVHPDPRGEDGQG